MGATEEFNRLYLGWIHVKHVNVVHKKIKGTSILYIHKEAIMTNAFNGLIHSLL